MKTLNKFISGVVIFFAANMLFSCNLEDFNLEKLADPIDIVPEAFAPLAHGTFKVQELVTVTTTDGFQIPASGMLLDSVNLNKKGITFSSAAIDSVYLVIQFTNETECDMEFEFNFISSATGLPMGSKVFNSGIIPAKSPEKRIQFELGPIDQDNLRKSSDIKLNFKLLPPSTGIITYGKVKAQMFTVKISFYAPVKLYKL